MQRWYRFAARSLLMSPQGQRPRRGIFFFPLFGRGPPHLFVTFPIVTQTNLVCVTLVGVKFTCLVSGSALSVEHREAIRRSIEDVGLAYHLPTPLEVHLLPSRVPAGASLSFEVDYSPHPDAAYSCKACGAVLETAREAGEHLLSGCRPKSAPGRLKRIRVLMDWTPLDLVVWSVFVFAIGFSAAMLLKAVAS